MSRVLPILFNTEMVRAILDGRKTVTRRLPSKRIEKKYLNYEEWAGMVAPPGSTVLTEKQFYEQYPPYRPGDVLYVRETWCWCPCWDCGMDTEEGCCDKSANRFYNALKREYGCYGYRASFGDNEEPFGRWRPSIHMPKEAARIFLRMTDVRVQRLRDITWQQVTFEGIQPPNGVRVTADINELIGDSEVTFYLPSLREQFANLWDSTIKKSDIDRYGWDANPWVWVIEFERCEKPEGWCGK